MTNTANITNEQLVQLIVEGKEEYVNVLWEKNQGLFYFHAKKVFYSNPTFWSERGYAWEDMESESYLSFIYHLKIYIQHKSRNPASEFPFNFVRNSVKNYFYRQLAGIRAKNQANRVSEEKQRNKSKEFLIRAQDPLNSAIRFEMPYSSDDDSGTMGDFICGLIADKENIDGLINQRYIRRTVKRVFDTLDEDCRKLIITSFFNEERYPRKALGLTNNQYDLILDKITKVYLEDIEIMHLFQEYIQTRVGFTYDDLNSFTSEERLKLLSHEHLEKLESAKTEQLKQIVFYREICGLDWRVVAGAVKYKSGVSALRSFYKVSFNEGEREKKNARLRVYYEKNREK